LAKSVDIEKVAAQLQEICDCALVFESRYAEDLAAVHPEYRDSARNLVHYLALRKFDIRDLQEELASLGLSSLGRAERNVMASIQAVQNILHKFSADADAALLPDDEPLKLHNAAADRHTSDILGEPTAGRDVRIMVTLPAEAGDNCTLVSEMIDAGMNVVRINCAHDNQQAWSDMVKNVRQKDEETGRRTRIIMDLSGPKIRTGDLRPGPRVFHIKPRRDPVGRIIAPRRVRFIPADEIWKGTKIAVIPVPRDCIEYASIGDAIRIKDTRGKKRTLEVVAKDDKGLILETYKGAYITEGTRLRLLRRAAGEKIDFRAGEMPAIEQPILLRPGDTLILTGDNVAGAPAVEDKEGQVIEPAHISCRQPEVFEYVSAGDRILLNDGKITGQVRAVHHGFLDIEVTKAKPTGSRLRGDRGINFPDSDIRLPGLTMADKAILPFAIKNADAISLSFVRRPADIIALQEELERLDDENLGLIIKIETKPAFKELPRLMLTAMRRYPVAIMIARGDLAVECGWERLAELQEEILWFCEAADMPVIWATQVLEHTAKKGLPSRAEISDAAMSQRADCVMLNKGPHIIAAIRMLANILRRMQGHQYKKTARLRKLSISESS
jgi:pyruvate kinase